MLVADKRRKEPRSLPRPWEKNTPRTPQLGLRSTGNGGLKAVGVQAMLTATQTRGAVSLG